MACRHLPHDGMLVSREVQNHAGGPCVPLSAVPKPLHAQGSNAEVLIGIRLISCHRMVCRGLPHQRHAGVQGQTRARWPSHTL